MKSLLYIFCTVVLYFAGAIILHTQERLFKSLTVGNKFVYVRVAGKTIRGFYEHVRGDTIVQNQRYALLYSSLDKTTRLERSDEQAIYVLERSGKERVMLGLKIKNHTGDTLVNLSFYDIGKSSTEYSVGLISPPQESFDVGFALTLPLTPIGSDNQRLRYILRYGHQFGLIQWEEQHIVGKGKQAVGLVGAVINGKVYGDTAVYPEPPNEPKAMQTQRHDVKQGVTFRESNGKPDPASNAVQFSYSIPRSGNHVQILIFSQKGDAYITSLIRKAQKKGEYSTTWDGKDYRGKEAKAGHYLALLVMNDVEVGRLTIKK